MTEPQPPAWWQPPSESAPWTGHSDYGPQRPHYRERRPVQWWTVLVGLAGGVVWFGLVSIASRGSTTALVVGLLVGAVIALLAVAVLAWKGDVGLSIGLAMVTGLTAAVIVFGAYVTALTESSSAP